MRTFLLLFLLLLTPVLSACEALPQLFQSPTATPPLPSTDIPAQAVLPTPTPRSPDELIVWVDPIFAPDPETEAGQLLLQRITSFEETHPGLSVDLRVKDRSGPAGLLETLSTVGTAAPNLSPDLITLDRELLYMAYIRGLVFSLDGTTSEPTAPEWYFFAAESAHIGDSFFSVPIGAEAHAFAYRRDRYTAVPNDWGEILSGSAPVLFPAADPQAVFTIAMIQAAGGEFQDADNNLKLDTTAAAEILSLYSGARAAGLLPENVLQLSSAAESWTALHEGRAGVALAPFTTFIRQQNPESEAMIPIPVGGTTSLTIADTWGWAAATQNTTRLPLVTELLNWLSSPEFTGPWSEALNLLPASRSALETWTDSSKVSLANLLVPSARSIPSPELLQTVGPVMQAAVQSVADGTKTAETAAQDAAQELSP